MKTRTFSGEEGNRVLGVLAQMAERVAGVKMDVAARGKFEELLNEAAVAFTAPGPRRGLTLSGEKKQTVKLEQRIIKVAEDVVSFFCDKLQQPIDVTPFLEVADRLHQLSASATIRRHGRPKLDGRFLEFVMRFGDAWRLGARREPGTSSDRESERRGGPFVTFVSAALEFLEGPDAGANIGDRVREALRVIKEDATSRGG